MVRYGEAKKVENPVLADFLAKKEGIFDFKLYPLCRAISASIRRFARIRWDTVLR
jgi:hypothetical protein